jgi:hypothetical protein
LAHAPSSNLATYYALSNGKKANKEQFAYYVFILPVVILSSASIIDKETAFFDLRALDPAV